MKRSRLIISTAILASLVNTSATIPAKALTTDTTQQEKTISEEQNKLNEYKEKVEKKLEELAKLEEENEALQKEINTYQEKIDKATKVIQLLDSKIAKKEAEIAETKIKLEESKQNVAKNLKIMERSGDMNMLEYIMSSGSFTEIYLRYQVVSVVQEEYNRKTKELIELNKKIEEQRRIINVEKTKSDSKRLSLAIDQSEILKKQEKLEKQRKKIDEQYENLKSSISQSKETIKQMTAEIKEINRQAKIAEKKALAAKEKAYQEMLIESEKEYHAEITGKGVVDIAYKWLQQRGLGTENPVIYSMDRRQLTLQKYGDCSAFTRRVYIDAGYGHIGYTTADQIANPEGQFIERVEDLQPGDLMYFGPTGSHAVTSYLPNGKKVVTAHTAIYVGYNKMIDLAYGVGTISVKKFGEGDAWEWYVKNRWVGGKRFAKEQQQENTETITQENTQI